MKVGTVLTTAYFKGQLEHDVFENSVEYVKHAERLGYDAAWILEHHFTRYGICPSALVMASYLLGATTRIRIGTAVCVAPLDHPVRLAEQTALLDHLGHGRLDFGVGRGIGSKDYPVFGLDPAANHLMLHEWIEVIRRSWKDPVVSSDGPYVRFPEVPVYPSPYSSPEPALFIAAESPSTTEWAAEQGLPMLLAHYIKPDQLLGQLDLYRQVAEVHGNDPDPEHVLSAVAYVADSRDEALAAVLPNLEWWAEVGADASWTLEQLRELGNQEWYYRMWEENVLAGQETKDRLRDVLSHNPVGTVDDCVEWLRWVSEDLGIRRVACGFEGAADRQQTLGAMSRFAETVLPRFESASVTLSTGGR